MRYAPAVAPRPHRRVVESSLGCELALFHLDTRRLHVLNGPAAAIWQQLHVADTIGDVAVGVGDVFGVSPIEIRGEIEETVDRLRADGLLQIDDRFAPASAPSRPTRNGVVHVDAPAIGSYAALDARVGIECDDEEMIAVIAAVLAPLHCDDDPSVSISIREIDDGAWTVQVADGEPVTLGSRLSVALRAIGEVNNLAVESAHRDLVLHAGAVAADGRGVLLPGGSNHGKSTLTTALVAEGFGYLTDEAAAVDTNLRIRPFAKSIALDPGSFSLFEELAPANSADGLARAIACREWHVDPERVGTVSGSAPVAAIVCPQWRAGASTRVSEVEPVEALHLLLGDAFDFSCEGQIVFERLVLLASTVPVVRLSYGDTAEAIEAVRAILDGVD